MVTLRVPVGSPHVQIDDFGLEVERSCKGSLHLHPGSIRQVTPSEWEHIRRKHPGVASLLQAAEVVVPAPEPEATPAALAAEEKEAAPPPAPDLAVMSSEMQVVKPVLSARRRSRKERMKR